MPFVAKHVRLTNSGKLPDIFLTAKVQGPAELTDAKLGKLFFVLQIDAPWNHVFPIGSSILNVIGREYYRQEGHIPLENFERAIAKANRLIEQLARDGDPNLPEKIHALAVLVVGDELHIAYAGTAEAYFLRQNKLNLITEPGNQPVEAGQVFNNLITGEISDGDRVLLGSPGLYRSYTTDELEQVLKQPLSDAGRAIAIRLKTTRNRHANAIVLNLENLKSVENSVLTQTEQTIYLDQPLDSSWNLLKYYVSKITKPIAAGIATFGKFVGRQGKQAWSSTSKFSKTTVAPALTKLGPSIKQKSGDLGSQIGKQGQQLLPKTKPIFAKASHSIGKLPGLKKLPSLYQVRQTAEAGVPVNHYSSRTQRSTLKSLTFLSIPIQFVQDLGKQFRRAFRRSPRTWYIVIALILLCSIGASIQEHKARQKDKPIITATTLEEFRKLINDAKQARVYGNSDKARSLLMEATAKAELIKQNPKLVNQAGNSLGDAERELLNLSGGSNLAYDKPLVKLQQDAAVGTIHEGVLYLVTRDGKIQSQLLTGGDPVTLAELPANQTANQLVLHAEKRYLYIQTYDGSIHRLDITRQSLKKLVRTEDNFPVSTGLSLFGDTLYLLDPANSQIWKYPVADEAAIEGTAYLRAKNTNLKEATGLAIDGSVFALTKDGDIHKFTRGNPATFALNDLPAPYNEIIKPLGFYAVEDGTVYYLADRGNDKIGPRIIELDKTGKFLHQYFLPKRWQGDIKLIITNPKSHKAWVLVNKELYEFTLVQ